MLHLKILGVPSVQRGVTPLTGRATQRHRLALLALLALSPGGRMSRDKLIAFLWPERDADAGRNHLKVTTYVLREGLGEDVVLSEGDELRLNGDVVHTDAGEFMAAIARQDFEAATSLYRGPLLDGFHLREAPDLEHWFDRERERLANSYRTALEALAESAERANDYAQAIDLWKRRAAHDPFDSRVALRLMQVLDASGNRAGALHHAAMHERMVQNEFGVGVTADIAAFVTRLREQPAVVLPAITPREHTGFADEQPEQSVRRNPQPRHRRTSRWLAAAALVLITIATVGFWAWPRTHDPAASIVVLPFANLTSDSEQEFFADGLTEEIIARLSAIDGLLVISRTSAMFYKGKGKPLREIADELGVNHVLEGSIRVKDNRLRVTAQLIDARTDAHLWAESFDHIADDDFDVQEAIAHDVATALELRIGDRAKRALARRGTRDAVALEYYRRGRFIWNLRTLDAHLNAIAYFEKAIARIRHMPMRTPDSLMFISPAST
jgi:TolB-like protein/DNA-binding SARP family transcriptional activator